MQVDRVVGMLDPERVTAELKQARRAGARSPAVASIEIDDLAAELDRLAVELDSLSAAAA
jgi:hypothetical protein